jgi:hypothetical protein
MELLHRCVVCTSYVHVLCAEPFRPAEADAADDSFWCDKCSAQKEPVQQQKKPPNKHAERCSVRNCPVTTSLEKFPCANSACKKQAHMLCYQGVVLKPNKLDPLPNCLICCCKKCYFVAAASTEIDKDNPSSETGKRGSWDCDGLGGPTDPNTSQKILMDWWLTEGNYAKYCGKGNEGVKKSHFQLVLANEMTKQTNSERTARNVKSKIEQIERSFKKAHKFATSETGVGLMEQNGDNSFQQMVRDICPYYYELLDIMADRAGVKPHVTTDDNLDLDLSVNEEDSSNNGKDSSSMEEEQYMASCDDEEEEEERSKQGSKTESVSLSRPVAEVVTNPATKVSVKQALAKRKERKSGSSIGMDRALDVLDQSSASASLKIKETERHNRVIEKVEMEKLEIEKLKLQKTTWSERTEELQFRKNLLREYHILRTEDKLSDQQIIALIPDMQIAVDALKAANDGHRQE